MSECVCLKGCPFFNEKMPIESGMGNLYRQRYCLGDNSACARFMIFSKLGKESVPADLYPNMTIRAEKILLKN